MSLPTADPDELLRSLDPRPGDEVWVFVSVADDAVPSGLEVLATFGESEGLGLVLREEEALRAVEALPVLQRLGRDTAGRDA